MMEKKFELVAWTKNITDSENARLFVADPEIELLLISPFCDEVSRCRGELEKNGGLLSVELARRFAKVYEDSARLDLFIGNVDYAIRFYLDAADCCDQLPEEFVYLCEQALSLARTYGFEHILRAPGPQKTLHLYFQIARHQEI